MKYMQRHLNCGKLNISVSVNAGDLLETLLSMDIRSCTSNLWMVMHKAGRSTQVYGVKHQPYK